MSPSASCSHAFPRAALRFSLAEFILETNHPSETNYPSETDNSSMYQFGTKTNYRVKSEADCPVSTSSRRANRRINRLRRMIRL